MAIHYGIRRRDFGITPYAYIAEGGVCGGVFIKDFINPLVLLTTPVRGLAHTRRNTPVTRNVCDYIQSIGEELKNKALIFPFSHYVDPFPLSNARNVGGVFGG